MQQIKIENQLKNHGFVSSKWCRENNIPTIILTRLVKQGKLEAVSRGLYIQANSGNYDEFYIFQYQYKKTVFSFESSLYLLGFTDKIINTFDVTVENNYKFNFQPKNSTVHYVKKDIFNLGVIEAKTIFGNSVKTYSIERTVCDFIKNKDRCDFEVYSKLLNNYVSIKNKNINLLFEYASKMKILEKTRSALEILL